MRYLMMDEPARWIATGSMEKGDRFFGVAEKSSRTSNAEVGMCYSTYGATADRLRSRRIV